MRFTRPTRAVAIEWAAALVVFAAALVVYSRFSIHMQLDRDEGIYTYSSIQLTHGVAPYVSIWDPKTPGTSFLGALAIELGKLVGVGAIVSIRLVFFATGVLCAVSLYLLNRVLWDSVLAALVGAGIYFCFESWAFEAPSGPDAKMPGIFLSVLTMLLVVLAVRGHRWCWLLAGLTAGLAFLFWQPLLVFTATAAITALLWPSGSRVRAVGSVAAGFLPPVVACCLYFAVIGQFRLFLDAAFVQPATGASNFTGFVTSIEHIQHILTKFEGFNMWTFWIGLGALLAVAVLRLVRHRDGLLAAVADPLICGVVLSLLAVLTFSVLDFQNYPDLDPLLPFAGIGFAGLCATVVSAARTRSSSAPPGSEQPASAQPGSAQRAAVPAVCAVAAVALLLVSVANFAPYRNNVHPTLAVQRAQACAMNRLAGRRTIYSLGDTASLVLAGRTNPDHFIFLGGGLDNWKLQHLHGGVPAWEREVAATHPAVVLMFEWSGLVQQRMQRWLTRRYVHTWIGDVHVFLSPGAVLRAQRFGIHGTRTAMRLHSGRPLFVRTVSPGCAAAAGKATVDSVVSRDERVGRSHDEPGDIAALRA